MSSSRNKSTGLRFLWIPGRKKHQHKGRYDTTNKQQLHSNHQPKKNEIWSLGGSKGHEDEIIKATDISGDIASCSTSATIASLPTVSAVITSTAANKMMENSLVNNDDLEGLHREEDDTGEGGGIHNTGTLIIGEHKSRHQNGIAKEDINSIEKQPVSAAVTDVSADNSITAIEDDDEPSSSAGGGVMMMDDDDVDAAKIGFLKGSGIASYDKNGKHKQLERHHQQQQQQQQSIEKEPDEKTVDCLYVAVRCCECSIS